MTLLVLEADKLGNRGRDMGSSLQSIVDSGATVGNDGESLDSPKVSIFSCIGVANSWPIGHKIATNLLQKRGRSDTILQLLGIATFRLQVGN